jgi:hypothetical protein
MLATIASLSDEGLRDAREHYATLLESRLNRMCLTTRLSRGSSASTASAWSGVIRNTSTGGVVDSRSAPAD